MHDVREGHAGTQRVLLLRDVFEYVGDLEVLFGRTGEVAALTLLMLGVGLKIAPT